MEKEVREYLDSIKDKSEREWLGRFVPLAEAFAKLDATVDAIVAKNTNESA